MGSLESEIPEVEEPQVSTNAIEFDNHSSIYYDCGAFPHFCKQIWLKLENSLGYHICQISNLRIADSVKCV